MELRHAESPFKRIFGIAAGGAHVFIEDKGIIDCGAIFPKDNPMRAEDRKRVILGRLEIKRLTANTAEEDRTLVFNPSNVPTGIETADMLCSFYSKAFRLSAKEERGVASVAGN